MKQLVNLVYLTVALLVLGGCGDSTSVRQLPHLGQVSEGLKKLDEAISHLDSPGSINRMDAFIIAVKRKINALSDMGRNEDVIPLAQA